MKCQMCQSEPAETFVVMMRHESEMFAKTERPTFTPLFSPVDLCPDCVAKFADEMRQAQARAVAK